MKAKSRRFIGLPPNPFWPFLLLPAIAILCSLLMPVLSNIRNYADHKVKESEQREFFEEIHGKLGQYYQMHNSYPTDLNSLNLSLPDGGIASLLDDFTYVVSENGYQMKYVNIFGDEIGCEGNIEHRDP